MRTPEIPRIFNDIVNNRLVLCLIWHSIRLHACYIHAAKYHKGIQYSYSPTSRHHKIQCHKVSQKAHYFIVASLERYVFIYIVFHSNAVRSQNSDHPAQLQTGLNCEMV